MNNREMFEPSLPEEWHRAFKAIGFGTITKILLVFQKPFWDDQCRGFQFVWTGDDEKGDGVPSRWHHFLTGFDVVRSSSSAALIVWWGIQFDCILPLWSELSLTDFQVGSEVTELLHSIPMTPWLMKLWVKSASSCSNSSLDWLTFLARAKHWGRDGVQTNTFWVRIVIVELLLMNVLSILVGHFSTATLWNRPCCLLEKHSIIDIIPPLMVLSNRGEIKHLELSNGEETRKCYPSSK